VKFSKACKSELAHKTKETKLKWKWLDRI